MTAQEAKIIAEANSEYRLRQEQEHYQSCLSKAFADIKSAANQGLKTSYIEVGLDRVVDKLIENGFTVLPNPQMVNNGWASVSWE